MNKFSSHLFDVLTPLVLVFLAACTGAQLGLNEVKPVNPTAPFSTMGLSFESKGEVDDVVKQLIRSYQRYGALYSAAEKEAPTLENTCYELTEKIAKMQPLVSEHEAELVGIEKLYKQLTTLRENDSRIKYAAEAGEAYIAKARERIRKFDDLLKITSSFSADCPRGADWVAHVLTGVSGLAQFMSAKEKVPTYNQTGRQLEELSAEERGLAVRVVQSLEALTGQEGSTSSPAGREG